MGYADAVSSAAIDWVRGLSDAELDAIPDVAAHDASLEDRRDRSARWHVIHDVPLDVHTSKLSPTMGPLWEPFDQAVMGLGVDVQRHSRMKGIKYFRKRKMCDIGIANDHLSVYIGGLSLAEHQSARRVSLSAAGPGSSTRRL